MKRSIGEISELYKQADVTKLPAFIEEFNEDERSGVKALVKKAQKCLDDLEKEKQNFLKKGFDKSI